ncbi:MAG TPA: hydrogen peroxide-dependent heme synthase [Pirellulales bacterium]
MNNFEPQEPTLQPHEGWHCSHLYYRFNRAALAALSPTQLATGRKHFANVVNPQGEQAPKQIQLFIVSGHKADFGLMILDPDPLAIDRVHQRIMSGPLGTAIEPTYSFVSITEVSEYVPTVEQFGARLQAEGESPDSPAYQARVRAYASREEKMRVQRLTPELPTWPNMCFYPMNKIRHPHANWFTLDSETRHKLMTEHGRTGMTFAGKVTQLITVSFGFDDWEWGVTLWATNPDYLKDIVYRMRYDEASAKYAEFGPFYVGYLSTAEAMLDHCRVGADSMVVDGAVAY